MLYSDRAISPFETSSPQCNRLLIFFILGGSVFTLAVLSFLLPVIFAILPSFSNRFEVLGNFGKSQSDFGRVAMITGFTVTQAFFSAILAVIIGFGAAFFCALREFKGRNFLLSLSAIPLSVPPLIIAIAYILFFGKQGVLNSILNWAFNGNININFLYSVLGIIIIQAFYNFPIAMQAITQVWQRLDEELEEVAALMGAKPRRIFRQIILPELWNPILSSFLIIFLYCFFSFMIILMFGGMDFSTLEVELYVAGRTTLDISYAGKIALIETAIAASLTIGYIFSRKQSTENVLDLKRQRIRKKIINKKENLIFIILMSIIILFLLAPLFSIFIHSFIKTGYTQGGNTFISLAPWKKILQTASTWEAAFNTVWIGITTSILSIMASLFFLYLNFTTSLKTGITENKFSSFIDSVLKFLPYAPLMISSVVLGFGFKIFMPRGSIVILILAQLARTWVFAYAQIQTSFAQIPKDILQAAVLFSSGKRDAFMRVVLPLIKPGIKTAFAFCFAISAGDASIPLLLNIPKFKNLSLQIFRLSGSYRFTESSVIAIILAVITGLVFFILQRKKETI
ncbi:MAG: thiamine ABC transporter permease [Treponema sp.]|nr:MAG: thiamine ABC transporter permease [Treponema sp.]